MYESSVPVFVRMLENLSNILQKGEDFAKEKEFEAEVLLNSRLIADMYPLSRQIQIACDVAYRSVTRLSGGNVESIEDNEKTIDEFQKRIAKTISLLKSIKAEQMDGSESMVIELELRGKKVIFTGKTYLLNFAIPNIYFHITTVYNILRQNGVQIGKPDFIGTLE
jgi:hypothetical protein